MADQIGGKGSWLADQIIGHVLGGPDYPRPASVYVGLFTQLPNGGDNGVEPSSAVCDPLRIALTNNGTNFTGTGGVRRNAVSIGEWVFSGDCTVLGAGVWDSSAGGNLLYWGPFDVARTFRNGDRFSLEPNAGTFQES